jgi:Ca2+-binding RTX toxin-like protein
LVRAARFTRYCEGITKTLRFGNNRDNTINGTDRSDLILAGGGNDTIHVGGGSDLVFGGRGFDTAVFGGSIFGYDISDWWFTTFV